MRKIAISAMMVLALGAAACAQNDEVEEGVPADTATMAPAPAPAPMDTMMLDTTVVDTTITTTTY